MDDDSETGRKIDLSGLARIRERSACAGSLQIGLMERLQRLEEPGIAVIEHMIVRKDADVDPGGDKASDVRRMHPVVDALGPCIVTDSHTGFEVHNARVRRNAPQLSQGVSPNVRELN